CEVKCIYRNTKVKLYDFFCQAEDGIRDRNVTGVQTCALPIFSGIAKEIHLLAEKARSNQLRPEDMEDGTFTVNNTGTFGSVSSMGIINYPQAAILQVETIVKRPVIIRDMFAARDMVNLSLSLDHRILDGLICGRFLARVKEILENTNEQTAAI